MGETMASVPSPKSSRARRARTSIAHPPTAKLDKDNVTIHGVTADSGSHKTTKRGPRSKSLGTGGLGALGEASGNRQKIQPLPRSILKPTIPFSPPKSIPHRSNSRKSSPLRKHASPSRSGQSHDLSQTGPNTFLATPGDGDDGTTKIGLRTEEEQQAAARERERQELLKRRDERRKSLANRRVSFAPEATLHTWDVVELPEDATSSSEATNSTRRASMGSTSVTSPGDNLQTHHNDLSDHATSSDDEVQVAASPASQVGSQTRKTRRSSSIPPMDFNNPHDFSSSPISSAGSDDTHQTFMTGEDDIVDESDTDEDRDLVEAEETITNVDNDDEDATGISVASIRTVSMNVNSSEDLDNALREATKHAGMQNSGSDQADFRLNRNTACRNETDVSTQATRDHTRSNQAEASQFECEDQEMTMEVTRSVGGILSATEPEAQHPVPQQKWQSLSLDPQKAFGLGTQTSLPAASEDETMDLTMAVGGIQPPLVQAQAETPYDDNEEMTMEFTTVVGGVVAALPFTGEESADITMDIDDEMDLTVARGHILPSLTDGSQRGDEETASMGIAAAVGASLPPSLHTNDTIQAKKIMEEEADHGQLTTAPASNAQPKDISSPQHVASESKRVINRLENNQDPSTERNTASAVLSKPESPKKPKTPTRNASTPKKQLTPQPGRPTTPSKTPPAKNVSMRKTSPKRLFRGSRISSTRQSQSPMRVAADSRSAPNAEASLTPPVLLTPKSRRVSGVGADQTGIGSPLVAAILDRRSSIGAQAAAFMSGGPAINVVRFEDPRQLVEQLEIEHKDEIQRQNDHGVLRTAADLRASDEADNTGTLREMIDGLTPKKNKLQGRKSLAIGGAKGLLGKRPRELDDSDDDATPKKLKGKIHSPVKQIHLPDPPSKDETTGRLGRAPLLKLPTADGNQTTPTGLPSPTQVASSPDAGIKFRDTMVLQSAGKPPVQFNDNLESRSPDADATVEEDRVHLRDFLNMTSIRFMELTTTKRRHTVAPGKTSDPSAEDTTTCIGTLASPNDDRSLAACVTAGASTIPMLELYQHSCRELKKYISEGRSIVREIEDDTYEENPPLFREYMAALPQVRSIMDNQFKNVKTHARLLSKEMWYEWRMKLLDGLNEGLVRIQKGLDADEELLREQENILGSVVPNLQAQHAQLEAEVSTLEEQAKELASCDPEELRRVRNELVNTDKSIASILKQIESLELQANQKTEVMEQLSSRKATCISDIAEADRVREELRGWSTAEVLAEKDKVDAIEAATGWTITSAQNGVLELIYKSEITLRLTPSAFDLGAKVKENAPISLSYTADNETYTTTQRFFLQYLRARLLNIVQCQTSIRQVLRLVEDGWNLAAQVCRQVSDLTAAWPTQEVIVGDEKIQITSAILLRQFQTKIHASFTVVLEGSGLKIAPKMQPHAKTIYGEELKEEKMADVLIAESGLRKASSDTDMWATAVEILEKKLMKFLRGKETS